MKYDMYIRAAEILGLNQNILLYISFRIYEEHHLRDIFIDTKLERLIIKRKIGIILILLSLYRFKASKLVEIRMIQ